MNAKLCPKKCTIDLDKIGKVGRKKKYGRVNEGCYHVGGGIINKQNSGLSEA